MFKIIWLWLRGRSVVAAAINGNTVTIIIRTNSEQDTNELKKELNDHLT